MVTSHIHTAKPFHTMPNANSYHAEHCSWIVKKQGEMPSPALTGIYSLQTKADIELLHAQNNIVFVAVAPFSPFIVEAWLPFMTYRICILSTLCQVHHLCKLWSHCSLAIASTTYMTIMTIMELFDEYPAD